MTAIDAYIEELENDHLRALTRVAHELILALVPQVEARIKYNLPFYHYHKPLCYLNPVKDHLHIGFPQGIHLSNEQGILIAAGRKQVRHLGIRQLSDLEQDGVSEIILEAALFNEQFGKKTH